MTKTPHYHLIIGVSDLCCKVVKGKSTCKTSCLLTSEHCLLAKVKAGLEEGNLSLRDDYGILRTLKATKAAFEKLRGRKRQRLTVEEKMPLIGQIKSNILHSDKKKYIYLAASALQSWAAVQRHRAANLLHVLVAKSPYNHGSLLISLEVLVELSL